MPQRVLVVANRKGGVTKTFTAYHVGYDYAERLAKRVLFIDADNGRSLTFIFDKYERDVIDGINAADFIKKPLSKNPKIPVFEHFIGGGTVSILRASDELVSLESKSDLLKTIRHNIELIKNDYDLVVVDTSPNLNPLLLALLGSATHVLVPTPLAKAKMSGVRTLVEHIRLVQSRTNPKLRFLGILPAMVNSRSPSQTIALQSLLSSYGSFVIPKHTVFRQSYETAQDSGKRVWTGRMSGSAQKKAADEMRDVCSFINKKIEVK